MAILNDLLVKGCSRFLQQIYVNDDMSVSGTLVLSKAQDAAGTANNGPALIVGGTRTAAHLELDNNELMAKGSGTTTADLYINSDGGNVYIAKSGTTTQILGLLKVQGNSTFTGTSTFTGAATFNGNLTANGTTALKNVSISSDLTVANNVKIEKTLTVEEEIRSPKWIIDNIANLGGEFVIAPTIICGTGVKVVVAGPSSNQYTITVTDSSITSASFGGISWSNGSVVKVSGTINGVVFVSVNGTMSQALNTTTNTIQFKVSSNDVTLTAGTYTGDKIKNLHIMMYKVGGTVPVGIFMTSYGANKYPYIEIYSGTGTNAPTTRLGYLDGLPAIVNNISPSGWGLYTNNGFFSGTIVSTSGQIGGWTLGTSTIYHGTLGATNGYMLNASGNSSTTINGTSRSSLTLAIGSKFAVGNDGTLYANGANITNINAGNISAGSISVDRIKANVISSINQSTETVKIKASKVDIDGTAVFSAISSDVDDAITSKGYQTSSQVNSAITSKGYATTTQAQGYATTAKSEAISAAATDATSKANAAQTAATNAANTATDNKLKSYSTTAQANNLYDAKGAAQTVQNNLDNLEIGGRNLLFQTEDFSKSGTSTWYFIEYCVSNNALKNSVVLEAGVEYTFSADVTSSREPFQMTIGVGNGNYSRDISYGPGETLTSGRVSITFTPTSAQLANGAIFAFRAPRYGTQGTSFTYAVAHPKLEKGNKATDWTPAPEDIEASAVKRTQRIWYRTNASSAPATPGTASSNWVTKPDDGNDVWTKMHVAITSTHKRIYTCEQYEMANGTVGYTSVLLDNTITVIDGGNIITNSITANQIAANAVTADKLAANSLTIGKFTAADKAKVDNSYTSQRNLSPYFSAAPYDASVNTYWRNFQTGNGYTFTEMEDGWMRVQVTNSTTSTIRRDFFPTKSPTVEPGKDYTFLFEFRNNNSSGTAKDTDCYIVQTDNYQFWGGEIKKNLEGKGSTNSTNLISDFVPGTSGVYTKRFVKTSEAVGSSHWTKGKEENVVGLAVVTCRCAGNTTIDYEVRVSVYEGEYTGPYRPYVGSQLYATGTALSDSSDRLEELIDGLDERTTNTENSLETTSKNLNDAVKDIASLNKKYTDEKALRDQWMDFTRSEGLVIGDNESAFKTVIGSTSMEFKNGDATLAEASGMEFIANIMRSEELHIGKWMWTKRNEGNNLSLKWVGN